MATILNTAHVHLDVEKWGSRNNPTLTNQNSQQIERGYSYLLQKWPPT